MRIYRRNFGRLITSWAGDFGNAQAVGAGAGDDDFRANVAWAICLVLVIIISVLVFVYVDGLARQVALAVLWGVSLGFTLLFYLPQKLLITIVGGVLGSVLTNPTDVVEKLKNFAATSKDINEILNGLFGGQFAIQNGSVFIFMLLVLFCCLPSYRGQGGG